MAYVNQRGLVPRPVFAVAQVVDDERITLVEEHSAATITIPHFFLSMVFIVDEGVVRDTLSLAASHELIDAAANGGSGGGGGESGGSGAYPSGRHFHRPLVKRVANISETPKSAPASALLFNESLAAVVEDDPLRPIPTSLSSYSIIKDTHVHYSPASLLLVLRALRCVLDQRNLMYLYGDYKTHLVSTIVAQTLPQQHQHQHSMLLDTLPSSSSSSSWVRYSN